MLLRFRPHNSTLGKLTPFPTPEILNSNNPSKTVPIHSDATVVGAGIHGLICPVHPISVFEKSGKLQWKIGESTLPLFAQWAKGLVQRPQYLLRLFGIKNRGNTKGFVTTFLLLGYQVERSISELLLTLAQRNGVNVWHGHQADVQKTVLGFDGDVIPIKNVSNKSEVVTRSPLLVDGTGRFRQYSSNSLSRQAPRMLQHRCLLGYWQCEDENASHTNHMCFPEGWVWMIRLLSWEGTPLPNLMDMILYLLDHAQANSPNDEIPSTNELAQMFGCSPKWVYSIGFSVRDDIVYPDLSSYGNSEGERRFRYWSKKYKKIGAVMSHFTLINEPYGPGTTWAIRKQLTYQTQVVSGPGWVTVGDGIGLTNPLHSPGITSGMATGVFAADLTAAAIKVKNEEERKALWSRYDEYCANAVTSLHIMNIFNYNCFRVPILAARVSLMWQFTVAIAPPGYTLGHIGYVLPLKKYTEYNLNWVPEYVKVSRYALSKLEPIPLSERPSDEVVEDIIRFSEEVRMKAMAENRFPTRWNGLFRNFDRQLNYDEVKNELQDVFTNVCSNCGTWAAVRGDWRKCYTCGVIRPQEECDITWNPPTRRAGALASVAEQKAKAEQEAMAMKQESMPMKQDSMPMKQEGMGMMK
ncbi:hypothetical protein BS47DRAFT_1374354 [Hydnum rufescens UP504]|uniref:Uncharacterized protein n=1 Tax=Hydnum rufescens UP504 TaxID=1448309 RepID=A0A9P6DNM5_9AGAM|nr:hypothetical protein BS47DRAFT_1374354 [Hydnum rufescens UP504]